MILIIVGVERMAVRPVGIYLVTAPNAKPFAAGMDRDTVLDRVNQIKSIREWVTCAPDSRIPLASRKGFSMSREMVESRVWTLMDRQKGIYWLRFDSAGLLDWVLFLNNPDRKGQSALRSAICNPEFIGAPAQFIRSRTDYQVLSD